MDIPSSHPRKCSVRAQFYAASAANRDWVEDRLNRPHFVVSLSIRANQIVLVRACSRSFSSVLLRKSVLHEMVGHAASSQILTCIVPVIIFAFEVEMVGIVLQERRCEVYTIQAL